MPRDARTSRAVLLAPGLYLQINFCEKNRPPIYEVDFLVQPALGWIALKMPTAFTEKYGPVSLCYKTEDNNLS
jgi:hypothetical protein